MWQGPLWWPRVRPRLRRHVREAPRGEAVQAAGREKKDHDFKHQQSFESSWLTISLNLQILQCKKEREGDNSKRKIVAATRW